MYFLLLMYILFARLHYIICQTKNNRCFLKIVASVLSRGWSLTGVSARCALNLAIKLRVTVRHYDLSPGPEMLRSDDMAKREEQQNPCQVT